MADIYEYKGSVFGIENYSWNRNQPKYAITFLNKAEADLWIPAEYKGYPLHSKVNLLQRTYRSSSQITAFHKVQTIHIPDGVTDIEADNRLFPNLQKIEVDPNSKDISVSGTMLIINNELRYVFSDGFKETCTIPASVRVICNNAFDYTTCTNIIFENPEVQVKSAAFSRSEWIKQKVPYLMIGTMFYRCGSELKKVVVPENTRIFDEAAFSFASHLSEIVTPRPIPRNTLLPDLERLLKRYVITNPVTKLDLVSLRGLQALESLELESPNEKYITVDGVLFSGDKKKLLFYPRNKKDKKYSIPEGTEVIGVSAFRENAHLEEIKMPDSVRQIGQAAFCYCDKLKKVTISKNVTVIPGATDYIMNGVFEGCQNLEEELKLPDSIRYIGSRAFFGCALCKVFVPEGVEFIGDFAFASYQRDFNYTFYPVLKSVELPSTLVHIGSGAIAGSKRVIAYEGTARGLIGALNSFPPNDDFFNSVNYVLWYPSTIWAQRKDGSEIVVDIPGSINTNGRIHLDLAWNQPVFDYDEYSECYESITDTTEKQLFALAMYERDGEDCVCAAYLKRVAGKLAETLIENRAEKRLISLIGFRLMTDAALKKLLKLSNDAEMPTVSAYIMQCLGEGKKTSKSLKL